MRIKKNSSVAVVVRREWANLLGVKRFLRPEDLSSEVRGPDDSHVIFARALNSEDPRGFWIELYTGKHEKDPSVARRAFLIPWPVVLAIVIAKDFSPASEEEARRIGYTTK